MRARAAARGLHSQLLKVSLALTLRVITVAITLPALHISTPSSILHALHEME